MALRIHGPAPRTYDLLICTRVLVDLVELVAHRPACDGHALAVQQAMRQQHLEYLRHTAGAVEIDGYEPARRLQVTQHGHALPHSLEVIDGPLDFRCGGNGEVVQHRVGRSAGRHHHCDRVFNRFAGDDVARL